MNCKICELYDYADEFWREEVYKIFGPMHNIRYVPIRIKDKIKGHEGVCENTKLGTRKEYAMVLVSSEGHSDEENRRIIRHELLHYALLMMNLKNDDNCAAFKVLCDLYDAHFYGELDELEEAIYDFYHKEIEYVVEVCKNNPEMWHEFWSVMGFVGDKEVTTIEGIKKNKGFLKVTMESIRIALKKKDTVKG